MKEVKLHNWILFGFVLGLLFALIAGKKNQTIEIKYKLDGKIQISTVHFWKNSYLISRNDQNTIDTIKFKDPKVLVHHFRSQKDKVLEVSFDTTKFTQIVDINQPKTIASYIQPFGTLFLRLLTVLAIPLIIVTLIAGIASIGNIKTLGRIGLRTFGMFFLTTIVAISIGLIVANIVSPGKQISNQTLMELSEANKDKIKTQITQKVEFNFLDFFVDIVPNNPFQAIANGEMLQIVFFAFFLGMGLTLIQKEKSEQVIKFFDSFSEVLVSLVRVVLYFAPIGVFALIFTTIYDFGIEIIFTLLWYVVAVCIGYILHFFVVYPILLILIARQSPKRFYSGMKNAFLVAFSSSSSAATLPVTFDCLENNLKVPKSIAGFVLPLGATMNMDGTSIYQGVAAVFIAQVYGIDLQLTQQLTILITALMASIGTAPVPGVGVIMLIMVLQSVGIPTEGIALILGVDRILDMMRTILNVGGDSVVSLCIARMEKNSIGHP